MGSVQLFLQIAIVLTAVIASGVIGYWLSRRHFREELEHQSHVMAAEIGRLKRQAVSATAQSRRISQEFDRTRRKSRALQG